MNINTTTEGTIKTFKDLNPGDVFVYPNCSNLALYMKIQNQAIFQDNCVSLTTGSTDHINDEFKVRFLPKATLYVHPVEE